jgi:hypothetical protein
VRADIPCMGDDEGARIRQNKSTPEEVPTHEQSPEPE